MEIGKDAYKAREGDNGKIFFLIFKSQVRMRLLDYGGNELKSERMSLLLGHGIIAEQMTK